MQGDSGDSGNGGDRGDGGVLLVDSTQQSSNIKHMPGY